jgi:hypothetical protein
MYAKVFSQIYDGTLCTKGPWEALVTFQQMLVLADPEGCVDMTASAISRRTTIPLEIIDKGIEALLLPDPESRTPTEEGRRLLPLAEGRHWGWRIVNYKHYRDLKREEDRRAYHREYWHKRKLKASTETQQPQPNQPRQETEAEAETVTTAKAVVGGAAQSAAPPTPPPEFDGKNAEALNGKAVVPLAATWELPEQWGLDAEALGFKPAEVLREAEKLRQWATQGKGRGTRRNVKGWRQTWSNWLEKAARDHR